MEHKSFQNSKNYKIQCGSVETRTSILEVVVSLAFLVPVAMGINAPHMNTYTYTYIHCTLTIWDIHIRFLRGSKLNTRSLLFGRHCNLKISTIIYIYTYICTGCFKKKWYVQYTNNHHNSWSLPITLITQKHHLWHHTLFEHLLWHNTILQYLKWHYYDPTVMS